MNILKKFQLEPVRPEKQKDPEYLSLGKGTSGETFLAWDRLMNRTVCVKTLHTEIGNMDEMVREILIQHELGMMYQDIQSSYRTLLDLVVVHPDGKKQGKKSFFIDVAIPQKLAQTDLWHSMETLHTWSPIQVLNLVWDVASSLYILHSHQLSHNDVKPPNILLTKEGAVLADYGLVIWQQPLFRRSMEELVSDVYRPPEMWRTKPRESLSPDEWKVRSDKFLYPIEDSWKPDSTTDLWSLGLVVIEIVASILGMKHAAICKQKLFGQERKKRNLLDELIRIKKMDPEPDFGAQDGLEILNNLFETDYTFPKVMDIEEEYIHLLLAIASRLLRFQPEQRWKASQVMTCIADYLKNIGYPLKRMWPKVCIANEKNEKDEKVKGEITLSPQVECKGKLKSFLEKLYGSPLKNEENARMLESDLNRIFHLSQKVIHHLNLRKPDSLNASFLVGILLVWGGDVILYVMRAFHLWGFRTLEVELQSVVNVVQRLVSCKPPLKIFCR